jgi:hypothetical protein
MLEKAIKCVYASVFFRSSKAYALATSNIIDEEKMGSSYRKFAADSMVTVLSCAFRHCRSINFYRESGESGGWYCCNSLRAW